MRPDDEGAEPDTGGRISPSPAARLPVFLALLLVLAACGPERAEVTLLGTTDLHGHLLPYDYVEDREADGSLAQIATLVDSVRAVQPHVLLFDSGDLLQGTPLTEHQARTGPDPVHPVVAAMNATGYTAAAVGNHEYDYGIPFLERSLDGANFPFLSGNIYRAGTREPVFRPYVVEELQNGIAVGVVGFTTPGVAVWNPHHVEGRHDFVDIVEAGRRWIGEMVERENPDLVVVVAHSGLGPGSTYSEGHGVPEENALRRLALEVPDIDVIFSGHTHDPFPEEWVGETLVTQSGPRASSLAAVSVEMIREDGGWAVGTRRARLVPVDGASPAPRVVEAVRDAHRRTLDWLAEPLAHTPDRWSTAEGRARDTPAADLIAEVQRQVAGAQLSAVAVFDTRVAFGPGPITRRDVLSLYVYPNTLRAVRISGEDLRSYLERSAAYFRTWPVEEGGLAADTVPGYNYDMLSGVEYVLDISRPPGDRVRELVREGRPVADRDSFTLAVNSYRQAGGGGFREVSGAPVVYEDDVPISRRIEEFLLERDTLRAGDVFRENWRLLPEEAVEHARERIRRDGESDTGDGGGD